MSARPYPTDELCDWCMERPAVFRVLDSKGREHAVCCQECIPRYQRTFEDSDGNIFSP